MVEKSVINKIESIDVKMQGFGETQAVLHSEIKSVKTILDRLAKTTDDIAGLRAESVALMRGQNDCKKERDELFTRLRALEQAPRVCDQNCKNGGRVVELEKNQKWAVLLILTFVIGAILTHTFMRTSFPVATNNHTTVTSK